MSRAMTWKGRKGLIRIKLLQMCFGPGFKYRGLLLVISMGTVVWFGGHEGEDSLVSWQVCSFKPMVPEGGAWKKEGTRVVPGGRGVSYVNNFISLDGFVRLCFM